MEINSNFFILISICVTGAFCYGIYICCKKKYERRQRIQMNIPENQFEYSIVVDNTHNTIHQNPIPPPYKEVDDLISLPPPPPYQN